MNSAPAPLRLLVIGGGQFVGRHLVNAAIARGHAVTVFNRGRSGPAAAGAEQLVGDRKGDLRALAGRHWDAVIDTCGYLPRDVARTAEALQGRVGAYLFVSSMSVYADAATPHHEGSALGTIDDVDTDVVDGRTYGPLKALCEHALRERIGTAHTLVVRPGLVVGPHDPSQRFTWWPARVARAAPDEPLLVPGSARDPVQFIDARDLADFMLHLLQVGQRGTFNAASPAGQWTMGDVLETCARVAGTRPRWVWVAAPDLERVGLQPWVDLPIWLPPEGPTAAFLRAPIDKALGAGLRTRALVQTVADTLAWHRALPDAQQAFTRAGMSPEREAQALAALHP